MSLAKLAKETGISKSHICEYENGNTNLESKKLMKICRVLDLPFGDLPPMTEGQRRVWEIIVDFPEKKVMQLADLLALHLEDGNKEHSDKT